MKRSIFIKGLTLTCFLGLLISFVVYKSGGLDGYINSDLQTSPNGGALTASAKDTTKKKDKPKPRMSGSKSMVIMDEDVRMSSSKSGIVFTPKAEPNSVKKADSVKAAQKK